MDENYTISDCFSDDCPYWIDRATAQERYNIPDKKWKKLEKKKTYVVRLISNDSVKYWEPDIQRMLESERTGKPYTESELLPLINANCFEAVDSFIFHKPLFFGTLCLLACWTVMPRYGFYNAGFAAWNIVILVIASGVVFYSTKYGDKLYWRFKLKRLRRYLDEKNIDDDL
jgi:hypothetical protein